MTSKTMLTLALAALLSTGAGCKKDEGSASTTDTPPPPPGGDPANPATGEVASYPNMVPQGGTKRLLQNFTVYQAADPSSKVLTRLSTGTFINLKGSYGNWMLIDWPSGVGQLSPGWIELRSNDSRVSDAEKVPDAGTKPPDAGITPDAGTTPDASTTPDAGTKPDGGGLRITLPRK